MADAMKLAILDFDVEEYVDGYEFRGDEGAYMPTEKERFLITDAIHGVMSELSLAASPPAREEAPAEGAGETVRELHAAEILIDQQAAEIRALRNRTSEPEAREGEAVAFDPAAFRAKVEAGWDAPPIETRLVGFADWISWCLDGKFDWRTTSPEFLAGMRDDLTIAAHPTPSESDDRLRVAVEVLKGALERINVTRGPMGSFYRTESSPEALYEAGAMIRQALASLSPKEGGK